MNPLCLDSIRAHEPQSPLARDPLVASGDTLADLDVAGQLRTPVLADQPHAAALLVALVALLALVLLANRRKLWEQVREYLAPSDHRNNPALAATSRPLCLGLVLAACASLALVVQNYVAEARPYLLSASSAPWQQTLLLTAGIAALLLLKGAAYSVADWTFFPRQQNQQWQRAYWQLNAAYAFPAYAIAALYTLGSIGTREMTNCIIGSAILYKIILYFKLITNFQTKKYGHLLIFLYFCTLEIIPAVMACHFWQTNTP